MKTLIALDLSLLAPAASSAFAQLETLNLGDDQSQCEEHELSTTYSTTLCTFEISVKTANIRDAGTNSHISLAVSSVDGHTMEIKNLSSWGHIHVGSGHGFFSQGSFDRFEVYGECMPTVTCKLLLLSEGKGPGPGLYVSYVKVTQLGPDVSIKQRNFTLGKWLAIEEGYEFYAYRDDCHTHARARQWHSRDEG